MTERVNGQRVVLSVMGGLILLVITGSYGVYRELGIVSSSIKAVEFRLESIDTWNERGAQLREQFAATQQVIAGQTREIERLHDDLRRYRAEYDETRKDIDRLKKRGENIRTEPE